MDNKEEKGSPQWNRGLVLDGEGRTVDVFPSALRTYLGDRGVSIFSMLKDSDAARLSEFCAVAPTPSRDPASFAANTAVFDLADRRFGSAIAVKDRVFSGNHTVVYLFEGKRSPVRFPDFIIKRLPERIRPVVSVLNGEGNPAPRDFPFSGLASEMKRRVGIDGTESLCRLIRSLIRKLSAYPELACGSVALTEPAEAAPLAATLSAGAFSAIFSLLVSALNSQTDCHGTAVSVVARGDAAEVILAPRVPGGLSAVFDESRDLLALAVRLPRCLEKLSLAAYLSAASGIPVDVTGGDGAGFSMTVLPDAVREEFKDLYPSFDPEIILGELALLTPVSEEAPEGE